MSRPKISTLILLRHGESIWNGAPETRFTGWCDVPLTVKGRVEAVGAGQLLRSRGFRAANVDVATDAFATLREFLVGSHKKAPMGEL